MQVSPAASFDLFPFLEDTTTGLTPRRVWTCGPSAISATAGPASAPIAETVMKVLRLISELVVIVRDLLDPRWEVRHIVGPHAVAFVSVGVSNIWSENSRR